MTSSGAVLGGIVTLMEPMTLESDPLPTFFRTSTARSATRLGQLVRTEDAEILIITHFLTFGKASASKPPPTFIVP